MADVSGFAGGKKPVRVEPSQTAHSLKLTFSHLKMDGWFRRDSFLLGQKGLFSGAFAVSFREGSPFLCGVV